MKEMRESPRGRSMMTGFQSCQRAWAWKYVRGFTTEFIADYFITGGIVHEAQEAYYKGLWTTPEEGYKEALRIAEMHISRIDKERRDKLGEKIRRFLEVWFDEIGRTDLEQYTVVAVEEEKEITLHNGFRMTVRLDGAMYNPETGFIFIRDTKTTGWSLEGTISKYMKADQPKLYVLSLQDEPWINQLEGWRTDCLYVNKGVSRAKRSVVVMPTEQELKDIKTSYTGLTDDIAFKLQDIESGTPISVAFYRNGENCINKFGHACPHYEHCHKIDDMNFHPEGFTIDPWLEQGIIKDAFKDVKV